MVPPTKNISHRHDFRVQVKLNTDGYGSGMFIIKHLTNLVEVSSYELLLLDELDVGEGLGRELNGLVESVLAAVRDVHQLDNLQQKINWCK